MTHPTAPAWRFFGLISNLLVYLNGFWKRGIRPKTAKDSQKVAGEKYDGPPFTMCALTMVAPYAVGTIL